MKYIIHSRVLFDTTEYLLTLLNTNTSIKLSNAAGHILEELIKYKNSDQPITREHLFSTAWRSDGLEPSHGNLNQQISLIRKSLNLLGIEPGFIITIPKRGLKLNKRISIKILDENSIHAKSSYTTNNKELCNKISLFSNLGVLKINPKYYTIAVLILIITILSISIIYLYIKDKNLKKLYLCKQINSCNICTFHQTPNLECNDLSFQVPEKNQKNIENHNKNNDNYTKIFLHTITIPHKEKNNIYL